MRIHVILKRKNCVLVFVLVFFHIFFHGKESITASNKITETLRFDFQIPERPTEPAWQVEMLVERGAEKVVSWILSTDSE